MINEKTLLCAFAYAEYESNCHDTPQPGQNKQNYMKQCTDYILTEKNFPEQAVAPIKKRITLKNLADPRDYIYSGHFETIIKQIEEQTKQEFYTAITNPLILATAINCPTNLYEITFVKKNQVIGQNLITRIKKELTILAGLQTPRINDIMSSHWGCGLEILTDWTIIKKYTPRLNAYLMRIKDRIK